MGTFFDRDEGPVAVLFAAGLAAQGPGVPVSTAGAAVAGALAPGLYLFSRGPLGRRAAFLASILLAASPVPFPPDAGPGTALSVAAASLSLMAFLVADRAPGARPAPVAVVVGWFLMAPVLVSGAPAGILLVLLGVLGHLALRPRGSFRRFLTTSAHLAGFALALGTLVACMAAVPSGSAPRGSLAHASLWHPSDHPSRLPGGTSVVPLIWLPPVVLSVSWALQIGRRGAAPFARTALAWIVAAAASGLLASGKTATEGFLASAVPLSLLAGAWLDDAAAKDPEGAPARWGVGGAAALAAFAGAALVVLPRYPGAGAAVGGAILALGSVVAAVRLFLLADPPRAAVDLALALAASAAAQGLLG